MSGRSWGVGRRLAVLCGFAVLAAVAGVPGVAAGAPALDLSFASRYVLVGAGDVEDVARVDAGGPTGAMTLVFDTAALAGVAEFAVTASPDFACTVAGPVTTCLAGPAANQSGAGVQRVRVRAAEEAVAGAFGMLRLTASATGRDTVSREYRITVAEGVDLVNATPDHPRAGPSGGRVDLDPRVRNGGDRPITGVVLSAVVYDHVSIPERHSNCGYTPSPYGSRVVCRFDATLRPGLTYRLDRPMTAAIGPIMAPNSRGAITRWYTAQDWRDSNPGREGTPGNGPSVGLAQVRGVSALGFPQQDVAPADNVRWTGITVVGRAQPELAAVGATVTGRVGDKIATAVGVRNRGVAIPNTWYAWPMDMHVSIYVSVRIPRGTTAVKVSSRCLPVLLTGPDPGHPGEPGHGAYLCRGDDLLYPGRRDMFPLTLRIDGATANGGVGLDLREGPYGIPWGEDPADNRAAIVVKRPATASR